MVRQSVVIITYSVHWYGIQRPFLPTWINLSIDK